MKNSTKARTTRPTISLVLAFTLLWCLSFQSFASEAPNTEIPEPMLQDDNAILSAFAVNPSTDENFDATEDSPAIIIIHPGEDNTLAVNFHCKLPTAPEAHLDYRLFVMQSDNIIYINYEDDMGNSFSPSFIFTSEQEGNSVELCIDEESEFVLDDQKMDLNFWENLTSTNGYDGVIRANGSSVSLVFTVKATVNDEDNEAQATVPDENSSSGEASSENINEHNTTDEGGEQPEIPEKTIELVDLTNDDVILDLDFYQNSDKKDRAEIEEGEAETTITLSNSANFTFRAKYYALPEFCNPADCNTHIETTDDGFTIYFETDLGETRSHAYKFQPSSSEVQGITLSYNVLSSGCQLNVSNPFGGLSAEECLFGKRGISDQVCFKAASIKVEITAKVTQPATADSTTTTASQSIEKDNSSVAQGDYSETATEPDSKKSGISIFIPTWLIGMLNFFLKIAILALVYLAGKKQFIESRIIPAITNFLKDFRA